MHSDIYIRVWGVLQGVISSFPSFWGLWWGISLARWLWQSLSQGTRRCAGTVTGRVAAQATELAQIQLGCHCKATALNRVQSCSAVSCLPWQHLIRTLLSEVPHSSQYNRDNATDEWTAATSEKDTEKMRGKQPGSPSAKWAVIVVIFMRSRATNLWRIWEKVEKDFSCLYIQSPRSHPLWQLYRTKKGVERNHHMYQLNRSIPFKWLFHRAKQPTS